MDALGRSYHVPKDPDGVISLAARRTWDVLQFIDRHPYVPSHYINAYFKSTRSVATIYAELFSKNYVYKRVKPYGSDLTDPLLGMPKVLWATTSKGKAALAQHRPTHPFIPQGGFFEHQIYSTLIGTSFAFATNEISGLAIEYANSILGHPDCPPQDPKQKRPFTINFGTVEKKDELTADATPFKLKYGKRYMFFWGFETDRCKEDVKSEKQNSIANKFRRYAILIEQDLHLKRFGMKNINIPFVTTSARHMETLMTLLEEIVKDPQTREHFIFTTYDDYAGRIDFPPPSGAIATRQWHRTDGPFSILETLGVPDDTRRANNGTETAHQTEGRHGG